MAGAVVFDPESEATRPGLRPACALPRAVVAANLLFFSFSLIGFMIFLNPEPVPPSDLQEKLDLLNRKEGIDLIFIGSSQTHFQFMPSAFDAEADRFGIDVRSFNLGLPGAEGHEIDYILERYVLPNPTIRYVFIEFPRFEYQMAELHERTYRKIYWHDGRRTLDAVVSALHGPLPFGLRINEAEDHLLHFIIRSSGLWSPERPRSWNPDAYGYGRWMAGNGEDLGKFADPPHVASLGQSGEWVNEATVRRQVRMLARRDIRVVYVLPPGSPRQAQLEDLEEAKGIPRLVAMNDPEVFPEFFTPRARSGYLLEEGARLYSEELAREFLTFARFEGWSVERSESEPRGWSIRMRVGEAGREGPGGDGGIRTHE